MKILMSAYACEPGAGSEPGSGWTWVRAAAVDHDVWVITRGNNEPAISEALRREPELRLTPIYVDLPQWAGRAKKWPGGLYPFYFAWLRKAHLMANRLHAQHRFDVAHHVTFAVDWLPTALSGIPGLPLIWGPVGGSTGTHLRMWRWLGVSGSLGEIARSTSAGIGRRLTADPVARRAALVVAQNHDVARRFGYAERVTIEPHIALPPVEDSAQRRAAETGRDYRQAVYVGRLIGWKGIRLAVATMAHPAAAGWRLDVLGGGPDRKAAERMVDRLGLAERVRFLGSLPRPEVFDIVRGADAMLFPSLHDSAPWAVGECLSRGVPVVCLDRGGPGFLVDEHSGVRVPLGRDVVGALARGLAEVPASMVPSRRYEEARLPRLLDGWYRSVATADRVRT